MDITTIEVERIVTQEQGAIAILAAWCGEVIADHERNLDWGPFNRFYNAVSSVNVTDHGMHETTISPILHMMSDYKTKSLAHNKET